MCISSAFSKSFNILKIFIKFDKQNNIDKVKTLAKKLRKELICTKVLNILNSKDIIKLLNGIIKKLPVNQNKFIMNRYFNVNNLLAYLKYYVEQNKRKIDLIFMNLAQSAPPAPSAH